MRPTALLPIVIVCLMLPACSDSSSPSKETETADEEPLGGTDALDQLASDMGIEDEQDAEQSEQPEESADDGAVQIENAASDADDGGASEEREWQAEQGSRSVLGQSRDRALDVRDRMSGGTNATLADTLIDEEYASSSGLRWDMPRGWRMAVPMPGRFAEMVIENPLGNASVAFTRESGRTFDIVRRLEGQVVDPMGGRADARTFKKTVQGRSVTVATLEGTYVDSGSKGGRQENIFYGVRAAIFDLGGERILIKMWGPQDTINQSAAAFDAMIEQTSKE